MGEGVYANCFCGQRPGLYPEPRWGAYSTPTPSNWIWGEKICNGMGEERLMEGERTSRKGK